MIVKGKFWTSISPNSESTVVVNNKEPAVGLINTLEKIIVWELPLVTLLPSAIEEADILTPGFKLLSVKVPKTNPVFISWDSIITWFEDIIELTIKEVLNVLEPELAPVSYTHLTLPTTPYV